MKKAFNYFFWVVAAMQLVAIVFELSTLQMVSKTLIVPVLVGYYILSQSALNRIFLLAMFFCWLGDVLLMFDSWGELFFMFGLAAFLLGHAGFIMAYRQLKNKTGEGLNNPQKLRFSFPIILIGTGLVTILYPTLGDLKIPVMVYALVLTVMVLQAIYRYGFTSSLSFWCIMIGALSFLLSDSILAINKFRNPLPYAGLAIMFTYMIAQYLISMGASSHKESS